MWRRRQSTVRCVLRRHHGPADRTARRRVPSAPDYWASQRTAAVNIQNITTTKSSAQLSRDRAMVGVTKYFAKPLQVS